MRRVVVAMALLLAGCGASGGVTTAPTSTVVATTTTGPLSNSAYARALLDARRKYLSLGSAYYAAEADALNLIVPPPGYALRHKALVAEFLAVAAMEDRRLSDPRVGSAEGLADVHLTNLAHELDPTAPF